METPQNNAAAIVEQAAVLDSLVAQFRAAKAIVDAAEAEIRHERRGAVATSGQERLADIAHAKMVKPIVDGDATIAAVATAAWSEFLEI